LIREIRKGKSQLEMGLDAEIDCGDHASHVYRKHLRATLRTTAHVKWLVRVLPGLGYTMNIRNIFEKYAVETRRAHWFALTLKFEPQDIGN